MAAPKYEEKKTESVVLQKTYDLKPAATKPKQITKIFVGKADVGESNRELSTIFAQLEQDGYSYYNYIPQSLNEKILIFKLI